MKVYFDIMNGKCIKPRDIIPPAYRATFNWKMKLIKLEACWSQSNLEKYISEDGGLRFVESLDKESSRDFTRLKLLQTTMKKLAWKQLFRKRKKYTYDEKRWTYREFWSVKRCDNAI
ncbi:hypothetical protein [Priestia megaterium]|uniref:hypothetical protein n=1 Tax=Priestia megaterium TaxID=1404 RepID=UPI003CC67173